VNNIICGCQVQVNSLRQSCHMPPEIFLNSVKRLRPTTEKTHRICVMKTKLLTMFRKMTAADSGKKKDRDITLGTYWGVGGMLK